MTKDSRPTDLLLIIPGLATAAVAEFFLALGAIENVYAETPQDYHDSSTNMTWGFGLTLVSGLMLNIFRDLKAARK